MSGSYVLMRKLSRTKDTAAVVKDRVQQSEGTEVVEVVLFDDEVSNERFALVKINVPITSRLMADASDATIHKPARMKGGFLMPVEDVFSIPGR